MTPLRSVFLAACLAASPAQAFARSIQEARDKVVAETMKYLNIPYLWGGMHPKTGLDCSGFVQLVYRQSGLHIGRVTGQQFGETMRLKPDQVLPGDLLFFAMKNPGTAKVDHVGLYMGKGYFVHASVTNGIHVEPISKPYYFERLVAVRKYRGF